MTNFQSIAGGLAWMLVSVLLASAALEPVSLSDAARPDVQVSQLCGHGCGPHAKA